jgi:hypothetical protein
MSAFLLSDIYEAQVRTQLAETRLRLGRFIEMDIAHPVRLS